MCCQNVKNAIRGGNALDFRKAAGVVYKFPSLNPGHSIEPIVQARQSRSLGGDHPNSVGAADPCDPATCFLLPHRRPHKERVARSTDPDLHMYGTSAHWLYGNVSGTDTSGWNGWGGNHDGQSDASFCHIFPVYITAVTPASAPARMQRLPSALRPTVLQCCRARLRSRCRISRTTMATVWHLELSLDLSPTISRVHSTPNH
ncbi:hypothetical protein B0H14DRAFT_3532070 [Mycena olivaceomarginata]|nr:hypothetical protein B0H14DRAFT_3532070 [Mycena olivaceomarginata]